jgi:hypothetical protein
MKPQNSSCWFSFVVAVTCLAAPSHAASMLYAPTQSDSPAFRAELAELIGGPVDYYSAISGTPSVSAMLQFDAVFTWVSYPYDDPVLMGDNLADYVDLGGRVLLGAWCYHLDQANYLQGRIMTAAYCPAASVVHTVGQYTGGGVDCVHGGVGTYHVSAVVVPLPAAVCDPPDSCTTAWRADRAVYLNPSNTGVSFGGDDYLHLTANMVLCPLELAPGDLNCDSTVNAFDIDPFVLALTDPAGYAAAWPDCDYRLADCNADGYVNAFDIDPFVALLLGAE